MKSLIKFILKLLSLSLLTVKHTLRWIAISFVVFVAGIFLVDWLTGFLVKDRVYTDINKLPQREYAMVLGTAKYFMSGQDNLYYQNRLNAAVELYKSKKADKFLLSGDNATPYYNEPRAMKKDLVKKGIPRKLLKQDFAGYDTQSSVIRADKTFHLKPFTIVSQQFHCERALMIAQFHNIDAICFAAKHPEGHYKVRFREYFARVGMVFDMIIGKMPKTLKIVEESLPPKKEK